YIVDNFFSLNDAGTAFKLLTSLVSKIKHYTDLCKQGLRQWLNVLPWNTTAFLRDRDQLAELEESEKIVNQTIEEAKKQDDE
ncbi:MAG: hypothetical protein EZS28_053425, partial [Streblomastix strix]